MSFLEESCEQQAASTLEKSFFSMRGMRGIERSINREERHERSLRKKRVALWYGRRRFVTTERDRCMDITRQRQKGGSGARTSACNTKQAEVGAEGAEKRARNEGVGQRENHADGEGRGWDGRRNASGGRRKRPQAVVLDRSLDRRFIDISHAPPPDFSSS